MRTIMLAMLLAAGSASAQDAPTKATREANATLARQLDFADRQDFDFAERGFIASFADPVIRDGKGAVVRDLRSIEFLKGEAPDTVNPSLWRNAQLTARHGLFKVSNDIWQVRGLDLSNLTVIRGRSGWIIVDPLTTAEIARAAMALVTKHLGARPVSAVIYTHSHVDHFGGVRGVVDEADMRAGKVAIYAPAGFLEHALSENVIAGPAMSTRARYMFGNNLATGPAGHIGTGIGARQAGGAITLIPPTREIASDETLEIDGVRFEFQLTPGTEAPAEMNFYLPELKALCMAENLNGALHNVLTPRGALVRDAKAWAEYLSEARRRFGGRAEVVFTPHFWPRWGSATITDAMERHRDAYKFIHDQTVRLMNKGHNGVEIGNMLELPPELGRAWFNRGHYGTVSFNARAVYQRYMGHYDGNPVSLDPLPAPDLAKRYVAALGGSQRVLQLGREANAAGDHRWAAELLGRLVMAEPTSEARAALASALEQLGYRAESAPWRNIYLSGAQDLRGRPHAKEAERGASELARGMPLSSLLDVLAVRLDPAKAQGVTLAVAFADPTTGERRLVRVARSVLTHERSDAAAAATLTGSVPTILALLTRARTPMELVGSGALKIDGDSAALQRFAGLFEAPPETFPLVLPRPQ
ncbi:alkyl/aryl-sulfatase [Sphingomonas sp.]|jgi:alkyl sulfatase BDS1-like metallo-beta-lactamase superfamily hydrolase|uniref:alkyl/aryl-sulfatase n=1 Tax=Sphingomonas sp. TaxID=28214 RepID=UPI002DF1A6F6|nr:alkyl sulfatase dimerization domain-containing protein [Sphingomonas sp.]HEV2568811.1 alkyl sulfatase dimerization domain-containing protein [Sphingomonas sp.]